MTPVARHVAWLGLGSNLDDPARHVRDALAALKANAGVEVLAVSRLYRTTPVGGPAGQPLFCNACAALACHLAPLALLDTLLAIEIAHGRRRDVRWGARTLDLDMLAYDDLELAHARLTLPHPHAAERAFVLAPLADIAPALTLSGGRVIDWLAGADRSGIADWQAR